MKSRLHFNIQTFSARMGGDIDAIISVLKFSVQNIKNKFSETKHFKQRIQLYRFAHFLRGSASNVSFDICVDICNDLLKLTDSFKNEDEQTITQEMNDKLLELEKAITVTCNVVDAYISSKSG